MTGSQHAPCSRCHKDLAPSQLNSDTQMRVSSLVHELCALRSKEQAIRHHIAHGPFLHASVHDTDPALDIPPETISTPAHVMTLQRRLVLRRLQCSELRRYVDHASRDTRALRQRVEALRQRCQDRSQALLQAKSHLPHAPCSAASLEAIRSAQQDVGQCVQKERQRLCQDLLQLYHIHAEDPTLDRVALSAGTWMLGPLTFPTLMNMCLVDRDDVNGVLSYTAMLVHQMAMYLGLSLPFIITATHGHVVLTATPLYADSCPKTPQALDLTPSVYRTLRRSFSNIEPVAMKEMVMPASSDMTFIPAAAHLAERRKSALLRPLSSASFSSLGEFPCAWMMLIYNIIYVAYTQGFKINRLSAATNPLWLLSAAVTTPHFAGKSHTTQSSPYHLRDISLPPLPFPRFVALVDQKPGYLLVRAVP